MKTAYNAAFEIAVLEKYFERPIDPIQWSCTMIQGLSLGLPAGLGTLGKVLEIDLDKRKMAEGEKLVQFFSVPVGLRKNVESQIFLFDNKSALLRNLPAEHLSKWQEFKAYCKQDVFCNLM